MLAEVWPFVEQRRRAGQRVVLARLVRRAGPGSRPLGATMAVASDGGWTGSVSGGCVEATLLAEAREVLDGARPHLTVISPGADLMPWEPAPVCAGELGVLICPVPAGGVYAAIGAALATRRPLTLGVELRDPFRWSTAASRDGLPGSGEHFVEELHPGPLLLLVGATDLAAALAALAVSMGHRVVVVDPRPAYAQRERVPAADDVICGWPEEWLAAAPLSTRDAVLVVTHDPRIDDRAIRAALAGAAGYVGALGSRETHARRLDRLAGLPGLDRLSGPAGLDLGAASLAETALSMLAEVVAVGNRRGGGRLRDAYGAIRGTAGAASGNLSRGAVGITS
ncbi:xanthine dehydrogenase accessory factor [Micromonospora phaseoli]|uniref:Xanthine dehydrogenase accessory factor n=1 Tax=Micromonospora phaseoli TaxID=1144548 RepID=A0A1H7DND8_9ACTN|nr:XdhC/CoxI family protein [Micromonospora phaseoli]PZV89473.1 xanthine dehydrogenase accessory factor [Micromonospora phaseoli]GIJ80613.1 XdhC/CoxI family protein [Micromonospora phaseoli]SEK03088.1 xanthine dehydrogenase accessory factor [Micromonospora phaseoli]